MEKLFKQYNIKWIGTFINVLYLTSPILGMVMYMVNAITFYAVVNVYIHKYVSWFSLPIFLIFLIIGGLILLFAFYKIVYRGYYAFQNRQQFPEDGHLANLIRTIVREELDKKK